MKLTKKEILKFLSENKEGLLKKFDVTNISLFGSFTREEETDESDIDLLMEMNGPTFSKLAGPKIYLERFFNRDVNIVRNRTRLKPQFLKIISKDLIRVA